MRSGWIALLDGLIGELERRQALGVRFVPLTAREEALLREVVGSLGAQGRQAQRPAPLSRPGAKLGRIEPGQQPATAAAPSGKPDLVAARADVPAPGGAESASGPWPAGAVAGAVGAGLSPEARIAALAELRQRVLQCVKCPHLVASRRNVVFGVGSPFAELMFVGEAPGMEEDEQGEPFVGAAGQLLTRIIQAMGFTREEVYIANILKCRPDTPGRTSGNRKPTPSEMATCFPYLQEQLRIIRPKVIVALGATAVEGLLGKTELGITRLRGQWQQWEGIPVMPTYHPAYLLRNQSLAEKRKVWEDMLQVLERLGRPISERQRNYFTRSVFDRS
jgi:DNA polymerase